ncbi:MAG TPA: hypothetical protein VJT73_07380, partial [Polyangiaceae bacterium]|nr:hypothetical protein [Polyangiaceae bacterium]
GPTGHPGSTQGWLLVGPERAAFSLDGATHVRWLTAPAVGAQVSGVSSVSSAKVLSVPDPSSDVAAAQGRRSPRSRRDEAPAEAARAPVEAPKASPAEATPSEEHEADTAEHRQVAQGGRSEQAATAAIVRGLRACYEKQLRSLGVRFSIQSSLSLTVLPTGVVREGVFNPPLSPTLLECVRDSIGAARFPVGATTREVRLPVSLSPPAGE